MLFPTTLVGSYPQPEWLIDRERLFGKLQAMVAGARIARNQVAQARQS